MKKFLHLAAVSLTAVALSALFTSCGDNNDEEDPIPEEKTDTKENEKTVLSGDHLKEMFPLGCPRKIGDTLFSYDNEGRLTTVKEEDYTYTFNYSPDNEWDVEVTGLYRDGDYEKLYFKLNKEGFAYYARILMSDDEETLAQFHYNADDQLTSANFVFKDSTHPGKQESRDYELSYVNGDIVKFVDRYVEDGTTESYTYTYTYTDIENKGSFALFDTLYNIDFDEWEYLYFSGIFGKPSRHLLSSQHYDSDGRERSTEMKWTLDSRGLPIEFRFVDDGYGEYGYDVAW